MIVVSDKKNCTVCGKGPLHLTVVRNRLPIMQNYVYNNKLDAQNSKNGTLKLYICENCGLAFNVNFDLNLLTLDEGYDNSVPSSIFQSYYLEIIEYLQQSYPIENGFVIDIGCGKGDFLELLCKNVPGVRCLGIDPSFDENIRKSNDRITFIKDFFRPDYINQCPSLVICRHVLGYIEQPITFLESISHVLNSFKEVPFFIEVQDTEWIIENHVFGDIGYEQCNYFTIESLANTVELSGYKVHKFKKAFGAQYIWMEATNINKQTNTIKYKANISQFIKKALTYSQQEKEYIINIRNKLLDLQSDGNAIAIWGMSTKGVVFANLIDPNNELLDACIDINPRKQRKFIPLSAHQINAPEFLLEFKGQSLIVLIMNKNYFNEIKKKCDELPLNITFMDATGSNI